MGWRRYFLKVPLSHNQCILIFFVIFPFFLFRFRGSVLSSFLRRRFLIEIYWESNKFKYPIQVFKKLCNRREIRPVLFFWRHSPDQHLTSGLLLLLPGYLQASTSNIKSESIAFLTLCVFWQRHNIRQEGISIIPHEATFHRESQLGCFQVSSRW